MQLRQILITSVATATLALVTHAARRHSLGRASGYQGLGVIQHLL